MDGDFQVLRGFSINKQIFNKLSLCVNAKKASYIVVPVIYIRKERYWYQYQMGHKLGLAKHFLRTCYPSAMPLYLTIFL